MRQLWSGIIAIGLLVSACGQRDPQIQGSHPTLPVLKPAGGPGEVASPTAPQVQPKIE